MYDGTAGEAIAVSTQAKKKRKVTSKVFLLGVLALVVIFLTVLSKGKFLSSSNLLNLLRQMSINAIISVGMTFCIISGGVDLSVGSVGVLSGCLAAIVMKATGNVLLGMLVGFTVGLICGLINGIIICRMNVIPFIGTMAMMTAASGVATLVTDGQTISGLPDVFVSFGQGLISGVIPVLVIIMAVVVAIGWVVLSKTEFGLNVYAIGGNEKASRLVGLNVSRVRLTIYISSGFLAALGGMLMVSRLASAQPGLMASTSMDCVAAVVVGGTSMRGGSGSMINTVIGAILMQTVTNGLNLIGLGFAYQQIITGIIIAIAVSVDMASSKKK